METIIDKFGRIVIPKDLREDLGFTEGTRLSVEATENEVILKKADVRSPLAKKGHLLVFTGSPEGNIQQAVKADRRLRSGKFLRKAKIKRL